MRGERIYKLGKIAGMGVGVLLFFLFIRELPFQEYALALLGEIESWGSWAPVVCVVVYVVWVLLLLPGSVMTVASGVLFGSWGIAVAAAGGLCASSAAFLIARHLGYARVSAWASRHEKARLLNDAMKSSGWGVVFLARLSPVVPYNITNYLFGVTKVSFGTYFTATLAGMLPGTALYAYAGSLGHKIISGEQVVGPIHYIAVGIGIGATVLLAVSLQRKIQQAAESARREPRGAAAGRE